MTKTSVVLCLVVLCAALSAAVDFTADQPNEITFPVRDVRFIRFVIRESSSSQPCIDELEVYGPGDRGNLASAKMGAKASASSALGGYAIHKTPHLNDGLYGNDHSWIAAGTRNEWAQIELAQTAAVNRVVFSRDRNGRYSDRVLVAVEIMVSVDGTNFETVARSSARPMLEEGKVSNEELLRYSFDCEELTWGKYDQSNSVTRVIRQMAEMLERFENDGLEVSNERAELLGFQSRLLALTGSGEKSTEVQELFFQVRRAKRRLFLRAPQLAALKKILFIKRQPFEPTHNYSVILDSAGATGGGICVLEIPRKDGRLEPADGKVTTLFDAGKGIARNPVASFDAEKIYFSFRRSKTEYFHIYSMDVDGGDVKQITDGPFHDYFPCPLPQGRIAFISTRCKARFLCWRPQAFVLFAMDADGANIEPLSHANLSEWTPSVMRDGRIIWMRSEYIDKGADFGHTLWAIRPDGTHPELIFGNNTLNCYANGREVPGTSEILCTLVSHGGDLNGPIALIDVNKGRFNPEAICNITPDVKPHYHMSWARKQCFRDPVPISRDYYLCSHAPYDKFGLYVIDRFGNRELLYLDPEIGSMCPTILRPVKAPPIVGKNDELAKDHQDMGQFFVADVYAGLGDAVKRPTVKYIRVCQEVRAGLLKLADGQYQADHEPFQDWYATPIHKVQGPYGWPSYVAKGDLGIAPVENDGSANFYAPAGKVLYFQILDAEFNEIQRMRSVVQLQAGEKRGCIGCHEKRLSTPKSANVRPMALQRKPSVLHKPGWGGGAFAYQKVVQPVWDAKCVSCHDAKDKSQINLTGSHDAEGVPASYRTMIEKGYVHYFDWTYGREHNKAQPLSFGTVKSRLWKVLDEGHYDVQLTGDDVYRVKSWIDLNCPLWGDYIFRPDRIKPNFAAK